MPTAFHFEIDVVKRAPSEYAVSASLDGKRLGNWVEKVTDRETEYVWPNGAVAMEHGGNVLVEHPDKRKQGWKPAAKTSAKQVEVHPLTIANTLASLIQARLSSHVQEIRKELHNRA